MYRVFRKRVGAILLTGLLLTGCSSSRPVAFQTDPPGAVLLLDGKEYLTPCVVELPEESTTVRLALGPRRVMWIEVPEDYDFWDRTGEVAGTVGAYTLYGVATPLIVTGLIGEGIIAGGYQPGGDEPVVGLVVILGAFTGRMVGDLIAAGGESLEKSSSLEDITILAVFPPASPTPPPRPAGTPEFPPPESDFR